MEAGHHFRGPRHRCRQAEARPEGDAGPQGHHGRRQCEGLQFLFKKNKIDWIEGTGTVLGAGKLSVTDKDDKSQESSPRTSSLRPAPTSPVSPVSKWPSTRRPRDLDRRAGARESARPSRWWSAAGVIGLELAPSGPVSAPRSRVVEYLDTILGGMVGDVAKQFQRILGKQASSSKLGAKVTGVAMARPAPRVDLRARQGWRCGDDRRRRGAGGDRPQSHSSTSSVSTRRAGAR